MLEVLSQALANFLSSSEFLAWIESTKALLGPAVQVVVLALTTYLLGKAFADSRVKATAKTIWGLVEQMGVLGQLKGKGAAKLATAIEQMKDETDFIHKLLYWLFGWWNEARLATLFDAITGEVNGALKAKAPAEVSRSGTGSRASKEAALGDCK